MKELNHGATSSDFPKSILVGCSRLVDFAGAEVTVFELVEALSRTGWRVSVAAFECAGEMRSKLEGAEAGYFDLSNREAFMNCEAAFDVAWIHHCVSANRILLDPGVRVRKVVFSSLSHFEPLECPPLTAFKLSNYLVNSQENYDFFVNRYPAFDGKVSVFHNSASAGFWREGAVDPSPALRRLAVVSNHIPPEVKQVVSRLAECGVKVDLFGVEGRYEVVTPELLQEYDAVITIGKTVQYCIAGRIPVYCYDHFGGDGWLTPETFHNGRIHNFSGRGGRGKISTDRLLDELLHGYAAVLSGLPRLHEMGRRYFHLENNLSSVLSRLGPDFNIAGLSDTDANIVSRQTQIYSNQRNVIANLEQVLDERNEEISEKKEEVHKLRQCIANLEQALDKRNEEISEKEAEIHKLNRSIADLEKEVNRIKSSTSWRYTRPLRTIAKGVFKWRNDVMVRASWAHFLLERSCAVIRYQGADVFVDRTLLYLNGCCRRKIAALRSQSRVGVRQEEPDSGNILVSFVIPVYDRTDVLREAVHSALNQTVRNIEVILVTDGSPAQTLSVVNEFIDDPRVRIFHYPLNSGNAVRGRNKAISEARGRYIAFLDSDDVAVPDRLERCLPLLESGEADVVYGAWEAVVDGSRVIPGIHDGQIVYSPDADLPSLLDNCIPCQSTVMVRKTLFDDSGLLKPAMRYREDHELWARLAFNGAVFKSIPNVLAKLRLHHGNNELNFKDRDSYWLDNVLTEYQNPGPKPKKIAFILPGVGISGGIAVVLKHASLLMGAGHDVFAINVGEAGHAKWYPDNPVPIVHVSDPRSYLFEGIDLLFATGWSTVDWLDRFPAARKLYFVQSDERRFFDEPALKRKIHETYLKPYEYVTEALWIKKMLYDDFGHEAAYVPNGLDFKQFFPDASIEPHGSRKPRVLIEGPIVIPFKGMADSYEAIADLDCDVWIVSSAGKPPESWRYDRFFEGVPFGEMRKIYSSCDIFLKMSRIEGFFGPPMEAMACGCAVVVGKVSGYNEYIVDGKNALVVEQGDVQGARAAIGRLIADHQLRKDLIQAGLETVCAWSWDFSRQAMLSLVHRYDG